VQRLIAILVDNAVRYTPSPGNIELRVEARNGKAVIIVRDSGIGIAEQDQRRIFERFYRVDKARSREFGGAGIGLAIADWIVQQHHGSIIVESGLGKGSIFCVEFPLQAACADGDVSLRTALTGHADNSAGRSHI
jgi:signal transduction histidine kinase